MARTSTPEVRRFIVINRIGVRYAGRISGCLMALWGLGFALVQWPAMGGGIISLLAVAVLPLLFGVAGTVSGALVAMAYNLVARYMGGLEVGID
jgi:hypothetical protein